MINNLTYRGRKGRVAFLNSIVEEECLRRIHLLSQSIFQALDVLNSSFLAAYVTKTGHLHVNNSNK